MEQEKYLPELMAEKDSLDPSFVHAMRLLAEGKTLPASPDAGSLVCFSRASAGLLGKNGRVFLPLYGGTEIPSAALTLS